MKQSDKLTKQRYASILELLLKCCIACSLTNQFFNVFFFINILVFCTTHRWWCGSTVIRLKSIRFKTNSKNSCVNRLKWHENIYIYNSMHQSVNMMTNINCIIHKNKGRQLYVYSYKMYLKTHACSIDDPNI